jgi:putative endonuclease
MRLFAADKSKQLRRLRQYQRSIAAASDIAPDHKKSLAPSIKIAVPTDSRLWWVYLLACRHRCTYAGVALNVHARFALHVVGKAAKFTRANRPLKILGARAFPSKSAALKAEYALKQLTRAEKLRWARANSLAKR